MKTEAEIRDFIGNPEQWGLGGLNEAEELPVGVMVWWIKKIIEKKILEDIPEDLFGFYCRLHKRAYLSKNPPSGCDLCKSNYCLDTLG